MFINIIYFLKKKSLEHSAVLVEKPDYMASHRGLHCFNYQFMLKHNKCVQTAKFLDAQSLTYYPIDNS